jgi:hypothetical protein
MVFDASSGHGPGVGDCRVVAIDKDSSVGNILWEVVSRPEGAIFVGPGVESMVMSCTRVQAVDEDEAGNSDHG